MAENQSSMELEKSGGGGVLIEVLVDKVDNPPSLRTNLRGCGGTTRGWE